MSVTSENPKVSIVLPTFNYARYLPEAIESILKQEFTDFELIISDDCSSDKTEEVVNKYAAQDSRIIFHRHLRNVGMVENWNWCLHQSRGKYIKYIFGDDCFSSACGLAKMVKAIDDHPGVSLVASARFVFDSKSAIKTIWDDLITDGLHSGRKIIHKCLRRNANLIGEPSAVLFRKSDGSRGFDRGLKQIVDLEMWFHLLLKGDLFYIKDPICCFRQHDLQQTAVNRKSHVGTLEMVRVAQNYIPLITQAKFNLYDSYIQNDIFHRITHQLEKHAYDKPELRQELAILKSKISTGWRFFFWIKHRLKRPFENAHRSIRKRIAYSNRETRYAKQFTFLKKISSAHDQ